ncbi:hypothetical protein EYF80_038526 [Liparis tanakae]|uniref:Uncharacterized protein n=1 Tax=Liparis tanakae TaxID=230148 RepID=A0A4Z2GDQ2_9TELE|nr:hypothetical protein EYF80_038526 [Liparis tanakae]
MYWEKEEEVVWEEDEVEEAKEARRRAEREPSTRSNAAGSIQSVMRDAGLRMEEHMEMRRCVGGARREQGGGGHRRRTEESSREKKKKKRLWAEGPHVGANLQTCSVPPDYKAFKQNTSPRNGALQGSRYAEPDIVWAQLVQPHLDGLRHPLSLHHRSLPPSGVTARRLQVAREGGKMGGRDVEEDGWREGGMEDRRGG